MKLADWMYINGWSLAKLQRTLGVKSSATVMRWIRGDRNPPPPIMRKIKQLTNGQVTLQDFLDPRPPRCAERVLMPNGRYKLVFIWSNWDGDLDAAVAQVLRERPEHKLPAPPIERALKVLGPDVVSLGKGLFRYNGLIVDLRRLVVAANRVLAKRGEELIAYPGVNGVKLR